MINKLRNAFLKYSDRTAYIHNEEKISYGELLERATEYASLLRCQGNGPVIIYGHKSVDMLISLTACIFASRPYIPIDTYMPYSRIASIIELTRASLIVKNEEITLDGIECRKLEELYEFASYPELTYENDIIYMIFTSGSTGNAKGVPISRDNLINFINWISDFNPFNSFEAIRVLNQASFSFDLSVADIFYSLCNGHTLVAMDRDIQQDFSKLYDFFLHNSIEMTVTTPTFIKMCLLMKEFNSENLPWIKAMYFCGEQLEKETVIKLKERFPNIEIINAYGPTEATSAVSAVAISLADIESEELLPVGVCNSFATEINIENDEIVLRGKSVFGGYLGNITGGYFKEDNLNCYRTGDIGFIKNNKLYCKGRKDSQIKYMGYRIELFDIESNIKAIDSVIDAAVVVKRATNGSVKQIRAYVVCKDNITSDDIKKKLQTCIPHYMIPARITIMDSLPLNENKKVDRRKLSEL